MCSNWNPGSVQADEITMREACRAMRYTVQPLATFSSCCLMIVFTSADRDDWLATKMTVAKETCNNQSGRIKNLRYTDEIKQERIFFN